MSAINNNGQVGGIGGPEKSSAVSAKAVEGVSKLGAIGSGFQPSISHHVLDAAKAFTKLA